MATDLSRWREADRLFAHWLELAPPARAAWLEALDCPAEVRSALESLLAQHGAGETTPAALQRAARAQRRIHDAPSLAGRRLGHWLLIEEIGRGGMSVVYRAQRCEADFEQIAAVKLLGLAAWSADGAARFERERALLARLKHPLIAPLIDGGLAEDGTPYLVMPLIEGVSLDRYCEREALGWRARVALLAQICDAVAYAHRLLVVHRDLKPGNVLVTEGGVPILLDFGIAKLLDAPAESTRSLLRAMTPAYAAPEQVSGETVSTATDVYALGLMLRGLCGDALASQPDLRNVVAMATREEPERRYPDARALAEDLQRLLAQRPVRATPDSLGYRLRSALRRHRGLALATAAVLATLTAGVVATVWQARRAALQAEVATAEAARATAVQRFLFELFAAGDRERTGGADPTISELVERAAPRLRDEFAGQPAIRAELLQLLGHIDTGAGRYARAGSLLDEAEQAAQEAGDARLLAAVRVRQGNLANQRGEAETAIERFEAALALGDGDPAAKAALLADALPGWAYAVGNTGREAEAEARLAAALEPGAHPLSDSQRVQLLLARAALLRDPARKLGLLREAEALSADFPHEHATRLTLQAALAVALSANGEAAAAVEHARAAASLADRLYPGPNQRRARAYSNLASLLNTAGRSGEAVQALQTASSIFIASDDQDSPAFAALNNTQGQILRGIGLAQAALPHIRTAQQLAEQHFGPDDRRTRIATRNLLQTLIEAGALQEAEALWQRLEPVLSTDLREPDRGDLALTGIELALALGDALRARRELEALRTRLDEAAADDPGRRLWSARVHAALLAREGDSAAAAAQLEAALRADGEAASAWRQRWRAQFELAQLRQREGREQDARQALQASRDTLAAQGGDPLQLQLQQAP